MIKSQFFTGLCARLKKVINSRVEKPIDENRILALIDADMAGPSVGNYMGRSSFLGHI
jgi:hypothetical protein